MTQRKQKEDELFTCQNDSCKKTFVKPLKALDFQASAQVFYEACPYCLSKVSPIDNKTDMPMTEIRSTSSETKTFCAHHLGYLCERHEKDKIPDECIVCKDIVSCMLKSLKG